MFVNSMQIQIRLIDFHRKTGIVFGCACLCVRVGSLGERERARDGKMSGRDFLSTCTKNVGLKE